MNRNLSFVVFRVHILTKVVVVYLPLSVLLCCDFCFFCFCNYYLIYFYNLGTFSR